ncbi:MAG: toxin-antitoxin system protein [Chloroflexota bacterium]|nr:toxin-antitoxin system protein [Chloroflexota bacterium]
MRQLAEESGQSIQTVIDQAINVYRREQFFASLDAAYDRLWNDPVARAEELAERTLLEGSVADDLDEQE